MMRSFRRKLMLFFLSLVALFSLVAAFCNHLENRAVIRDAIRGKGRVMVETLSQACRAGVLNSDVVFLNRTVRHAASLDDVVLLAVYDASGRVILDSSQGEVDASFPGVPGAGTGFREMAVTRNDQLVAFDFLAPVVHAGGTETVRPSVSSETQVIGYVRMALSTRAMDRALYQSLTGPLAMGLVFLLLGSLAVAVFSRYLTRPIVRLSALAGRVGKGEAVLPEAVGARDEMGILNAMAERLRDFEAEKRAFYAEKKDLTGRVEDRNRKFRESEQRFHQLAENITEVFWIRSLDWKVVHYVSPAYETQWGYSCESLYEAPLSWLEHIVSEDRQVVEAFMKERDHGDRADGFPAFRVRWADGSVRWIEVRWFPMIDEKGATCRIAGISRDITRKKEAEELARENRERSSRMKRMESLGVMVSGIAHDLNNILSAIVGYPDLILMDMPEDSPMARPVKMIKQSGERAAEIVSDLLTVARGAAVEKGSHNLNLSVRECLASAEFRKLEHLYPEVRYVPDLDENLLNARYSASHLRKSIMNLVTNASEAVDGAGTVTISTRNVYMDRPFKEGGDVARGEYVVLRVRDTGPVIPADDLQKIFEPFYSRKVLGRSGSGLGLSVVWNTVRDHDGHMDVTSDNGGTLFEIYLPGTRSPG
ncbi:ATP-binding protein [Desulfoluna spongiiphila]|uniref:ATP-binding protein n=1 Tax=Desulfoluna spongiiphila TaxID=419481 RepID=UPI0012564A27|nr:ATP-binding protein [Desulfoluna spongiiphila]VVS92053.1 pas fold-3 [Desulfoluna spongiiphila]